MPRDLLGARSVGLSGSRVHSARIGAVAIAILLQRKLQAREALLSTAQNAQAFPPHHGQILDVTVLTDEVF